MTFTRRLASHSNFEQIILDFFEGQGFLVGSCTYHDVLDNPELVELLQVRQSCCPTATYVSGRADRIAAHREQPVQLEWEAKTHNNPMYEDMTLEAFPLTVHVNNARLYGTRCLYCYHNPFGAHPSAGFWTHDPPPIRCILIPSRWSPEMKAWFDAIFSRAFPETDIGYSGRTGGSGDPFAIIDKTVVDELPPWQDLVLDLLSEQGSSA